MSKRKVSVADKIYAVNLYLDGKESQRRIADMFDVSLASVSYTHLDVYKRQAHKGIGTDPNVNHRVPKFLFSTIYPIVSHSYLYYLTCAFIINDSITETTFPISLLILHLVIAVFAHSGTRPKKASGILIISKQSNPKTIAKI